MRWVRGLQVLLAATTFGIGTHAVAGNPPVDLVTLGTIAGPPPTVDRAQNSQVLIVDGNPYLVDAGENAVRRLKQADVDHLKVGTILITHPHGDHVHGLPSLLSTSWYYGRAEPIRIYGPPGTKETVDTAKAFVNVDAKIRVAIENAGKMPFMEFARGQDVEPGNFYRDAAVSIQAIENSHFQFPQGHPDATKYKSYSYKFIIGDKTVVFTGDTGPSAELVAFAKGADVIVSECLALDEIRARRAKNRYLAGDAPGGPRRVVSPHAKGAHHAGRSGQAGARGWCEDFDPHARIQRGCARG